MDGSNPPAAIGERACGAPLSDEKARAVRPGPSLIPWENRAVAMTGVEAKIDRLHEVLRAAEHVVVAYSGGTDSTLVAAAAARVLGDRALAVTAVSPSLAPGEADEARRVALGLGIRHRVLRTQEAENPSYLANGMDRCYHCKTELYD